MTCYCGLTTCTECYGTKMSDFAAANSISTADRFPIVRGSAGSASNLTVTYAQLRTALGLDVSIDNLDAIPNGTVVKVVDGNLVASSIVEDTDSVNFGLDIEVPGASIHFDDSAVLSNIGGQLQVESDSVKNIVMQSKVDATQSYKPQWANLGAEAVENIQTTDTSTMTGTSISFALTLAGTDVPYRINSIRLRGAAVTTGVRMTISDGPVAVDRSNVIFSWPKVEQWESGDGYSFAVGDFTIDSFGVLLNSDNSNYITFDVPAGAGSSISVKGDGTTPFIRIDRQTGTNETISTITGYEIDTADSPFTVPSGVRLANIFCDATAGNISITLPTPSINLEFSVIKTDATANTVTVNSAAGIIGSPTLVLSSQYDAPVIVSSSSEYYLK